MENYIKLPKELKAIDGHLHTHRLFEEERQMNFIGGHEWYKEECGLYAINIASLPRNASNNIACALYKVAYPDTYAHGCLFYPARPFEKQIDGFDPLTQYNELMEIGFDGMKMLEGKPECYQRSRVPLDDKYYEAYFTQAEKDKTHILTHINDPAFFWDESKASDYVKQKGWFYGNGDYASNTELYAQMDNLFEKHPNLNMTLAHFYFRSENPEILEKMFEKYPNLAIDITPGGEMYLDFNKRPEYFHNFFTKYSEKILFGTDGDFPRGYEAMKWLVDRIYRFLKTDEVISSFEGEMIKGIKIDDCHIENIFSKNFLRRVGESPRQINKKALKTYMEKYLPYVESKYEYDLLLELSKKML
ncbi:MAG: amidohydrolase family protein [Clostridia bacterium]|nr:amidohydrolase family protein [Clostridia bacterium]